jgi:hypothetical protein
VRGDFRARRRARDLREGQRHGARQGAQAAIGARADDVEDGVFADEVRAVVDGTDSRRGAGFGEGERERPFLDVGGRGVVPGAGAAAAEEGGEEGEDEGFQRGAQAHGRVRVVPGRAAGGAWGPGGGTAFHWR